MLTQLFAIIIWFLSSSLKSSLLYILLLLKHQRSEQNIHLLSHISQPPTDALINQGNDNS